MHNAKITVETLTIPTYPEGAREEMPMFVENRGHQRSTGRAYPNKVTVRVDREGKFDKDYIAVHLENDYIDVWVLPEIGGRVFAAQDKSTGYDFFYRQHVIKPALIGSLGSWISGGVEFNWPYHHRPSGFMPCDFTTETCEDGSVICWLSEHEPVDRMKGMVGIVLQPDATYLETRVKLCNRSPLQHSFLWWENTAVPVNEQYQIFFPHDVTYVNFHYLDSRISYPIAGDNVFNGIDMTEPRDISMHKNTKDATSYFACASKYDFFGGYDHGKECGVVHIADRHISPGKKMFTWAYNQLSKTWENALTDTDGQYAELMAGSYSDNQPNFSWLEPYETKEFSQYWYPISKIGTPDYASLDGAARLGDDALYLQPTSSFGKCTVTASCGGETVLSETVELTANTPVILPWNRPAGLVSLVVTAENGETVLRYDEEDHDQLKMPPVKDPMPLATEVASADELYLAGVHVDQYRDPAVMPDAYWLEALKRNPKHAPSLLGMARYRYTMQDIAGAKKYAEKAIAVLTQFNERLESGEAYYLYALALEANEEYEKAYDYYYKAAWCGSSVAKAMGRIACLDLRKGDKKEAVRHAHWALKHDVFHPLAPVVLMLAQPEKADAIAASVLAEDPMDLLVNYLHDPKNFFKNLQTEGAQVALDLVTDLDAMGQDALCVQVLEDLIAQRPEEKKAMVLLTLAYYRQKLGQAHEDLVKEAEGLDVGLCYPNRLLESKVLRFAIGAGSNYAKFLLGCLLYDKRHYQEGADLFEEYTAAVPGDYMGWRCLAVACFSHLDRKADALKYMHKAIDLSDSAQLLYEMLALMDKLSIAPAEKIALLTSRKMDLDNLFTELAKAYNQNGEPEKALEVLGGHTFVACEGGEHAISDQYMFAYYLLAQRHAAEGSYEAAVKDLEDSLVLPQHLGSGIWNRCKYVPYNFARANCLEKLGRTEEAIAIYRQILDIQVEFFSNMHLPELPWYQAQCANKLGLHQKAQNLMTTYKRVWTAGMDKVDNGYFNTTPFFISFIDNAAQMRRAYFLYLTGLVDLYDGKTAAANEKLAESYQLNSENLFCGLRAGKIG